MKKRSITVQFYLGAAGILFVFCLAASVLEYRMLQNQVADQVESRAETFLQTAVAIRTYAKDTLRPVVTGLVHSDRFVREAMSTSFVSRRIMMTLQESLPGFHYKRAAANPRNPVNRADGFEEAVILGFNQDPAMARWS